MDKTNFQIKNMSKHLRFKTAVDEENDEFCVNISKEKPDSMSLNSDIIESEGFHLKKNKLLKSFADEVTQNEVKKLIEDFNINGAIQEFGLINLVETEIAALKFLINIWDAINQQVLKFKDEMKLSIIKIQAFKEIHYLIIEKKNDRLKMLDIKKILINNKSRLDNLLDSHNKFFKDNFEFYNSFQRAYHHFIRKIDQSFREKYNLKNIFKDEYYTSLYSDPLLNFIFKNVITINSNFPISKNDLIYINEELVDIDNKREVIKLYLLCLKKKNHLIQFTQCSKCSDSDSDDYLNSNENDSNQLTKCDSLQKESSSNLNDILNFINETDTKLDKSKNSKINKKKKKRKNKYQVIQNPENEKKFNESYDEDYEIFKKKLTEESINAKKVIKIKPIFSTHIYEKIKIALGD